jgi:cell division initiation protein
MIDLTPLEVRKKKGDFRRGMRGYDPQSVDDFLDVIADRLEQLVRENGSLTDRVRRSEEQVNDYRERERALTEALVTAQEMREQMRQQIEKEVELKRREAEADADSIRAQAEQVREREEESIRRLRARQSQFVQSYRAFLERELSELSVMTESLDLGRATESTPPRRPRPRPPEKPRAAQREVAPEPPEFEPEPEPDPVPMPLPRAIPEPPRSAAPPIAAAAPVVAQTPEYGTPVRGDDFDFDGPFIPEPEPDSEPEAEAPFEFDPKRELEPMRLESAPPQDRSFDEMLADLPTLAPAPQTAKPAAPLAALNDEESEVLADVRAKFDAVAADDDLLIPEPEPMPEAEDVLDLVDDVADDEEEDGWMSTLLEGRGDDRVQ